GCRRFQASPYLDPKIRADRVGVPNSLRDCSAPCRAEPNAGRRPRAAAAVCLDRGRVATSGGDLKNPERLRETPSEHGAGYADDATPANFGSKELHEDFGCG